MPFPIYLVEAQARPPTPGHGFDAKTVRLRIAACRTCLASVCAMGERCDGTSYLSQIRQRGAPKDALGPCLVAEEQTHGR